VLLQADINIAVKKAQDKAGGNLSKDESKELRAMIDKKIEDFTRRFQADRPSRLFWVSWLIRTGRSDQAVIYLKDPTNFPGAKDDVYQRMMALALAAAGDKQESAKLLQQLPQDPLVDKLIISMAATSEARQKSVQEAMARYVSNGIFRIWDGELKFDDKRYQEAARVFFNALDFTRVRPNAENGLRRSLLALAEEQPKDGRTLIEEMLRDYPDEPALLLPYAVTLMRLDEIGQPADEWELVRTMSSALNAWERALAKREIRDVNIALIRAELWMRCNQPEIARTEVLRAIKQAPENQANIVLAIRLDLSFATKAHLADARTYLQQLQKLNSDGVTTILLEAQLEDAEKHTDQAVARLTKLVEKNAQVADAFALLVQYTSKQKRPAKALEWSETWAEKMPDNLAAATTLVTQLTAARKLPDAVKQAETFTQARLKEYAKRLEERKFLDDKNPDKTRQALLDDLRWGLDLAFAQAFATAGELGEAENRYERLLKERENSVVLMALGNIHLSRGAWQKCVQVYEKVLDKEKDNFVAGNNLAWILTTELNNPARALEVLRSVSKGKFSGKDLPGDRLHPDVLDTLGTIHQKLAGAGPEVNKQMAQTFESASKRYPRDGRMYLYLAWAQAGLKDNAKASTSLASALALAKDAENPGMSEPQREMVIREVEAMRKRLALK
jgi:tetratricopeptide (TPR) repeat protein